MSFFSDLIIIYLIIYGASTLIYLITGLALNYFNRSNPHRRIQKNRNGKNRAKVEILSSIKALAISSLLISGGYFMQLNGLVLVTPYPATPLNISISFIVIFLLYDAWFYWGHRLLHLKKFYRWHKPHHQSIAPTAWSNDSSATIDTIIEHFFYFFVWIVLPVPAISIFALRVFDQITGMIGHCGFEYFAGKTSRRPYPFLCTTFHDLHHSQFHYNYGNFLSLWDRWMKTIHPKYDQIVREIEKNGKIPDEIAMRVDK